MTIQCSRPDPALDAGEGSPVFLIKILSPLISKQDERKRIGKKITHHSE